MRLKSGQSPQVHLAVIARCVLSFVCHHIYFAFKDFLADCAGQVSQDVIFQTLFCSQYLVTCGTNTWFAVLRFNVKCQILLRPEFLLATLACQVSSNVALQALIIAKCLLAHRAFSGVLWICLGMLVGQVSLQPCLCLEAIWAQWTGEGCN